MKKPFSFGLKLNFKEKKIEQSTNVINLVHNTEGHNKFYNLSLVSVNNTGYYQQFPFNVNIIYGKIGTVGSTLTHKFTERSMAHDFMLKRMREKLKKGYKRII